MRLNLRKGIPGVETHARDCVRSRSFFFFRSLSFSLSHLSFFPFFLFLPFFFFSFCSLLFLSNGLRMHFIVKYSNIPRAFLLPYKYIRLEICSSYFLSFLSLSLSLSLSSSLFFLFVLFVLRKFIQ